MPRHSSTITIWLTNGLMAYRVARTGPTLVGVRGTSIEHPPGRWVLKILVDGNMDEQWVYLPSGIGAGEDVEVEYREEE